MLMRAASASAVVETRRSGRGGAAGAGASASVRPAKLSDSTTRAILSYFPLAAGPGGGGPYNASG
jgi:hypothetical protein